MLRALPFAVWALVCLVRGQLRVDHVVLLAVVVVLASIPRAHDLLRGLYPFGLVALVYDAMRPFMNVGIDASRVHVCDIRALDAALFGSGGRTIHDYFFVHHTTALDLVCAVPYATFVLYCLGVTIALYFKDRPAMRRFTWGFFTMNVAAFVTYHLVPAAPPWYFHAHGCAVDLGARASEGPALARVDTLLGVGLFRGMYGRASSVFGALPSLHCAYPILALIEMWRVASRPVRALAGLFAAWMIFSAVYLDHHWVVDAVLGAAFAVVTALSLRALERRAALRAAPAPAEVS